MDLTPAHKHLVAVLDAAQELGYLVIELSTKSIRMVRVRDELEVTIESRYLDAEFLHQVLRPAGPAR